MHENPYEFPSTNRPESRPGRRAWHVIGGTIALLGSLAFTTLAIRGFLIAFKMLPGGQLNPINRLPWAVVFAGLAMALFHLGCFLFSDDRPLNKKNPPSIP